MTWGPNTARDTARFIDKALTREADPKRTVFDFAITVTGTGFVVGGCELRLRSAVDQRASIGYTLNPDHWGHGYATETARMLIEFGHQTRGLHRIEAMCDPDNLASTRVLLKAGMDREGLLRDYLFYRNAWHDCLMFASVEPA